MEPIDVLILLTGFLAILTIGAWWAGRPSAAARDAMRRNHGHRVRGSWR